MNKINGYDVIRRKKLTRSEATRPGSVILVDKKTGEFVTALHFEGEKEWLWGHYIRDRDEAFFDWHRRICADDPMHRFTISALRQHLFLHSKGMRNSQISAVEMLKKAEHVTGREYRRGEYERAAEDLRVLRDRLAA